MGFRTQGELTHFVWLTSTGERGPYDVRWLAYRNFEQLLEILALLRSLSDQVYSVSIMEPPEIQLQSLLSRPFRSQALTKNSPHAAQHKAIAWWQMRVLDLHACVAALSCPGEITFQLDLRDPLDAYLHDGWQGVGGDYVVRLGATSEAERGTQPGLPVLQASVNAFTRLLLGVAPASGLAATDQFRAPQALLQALDGAVRLPRPVVGWDF